MSQKTLISRVDQIDAIHLNKEVYRLIRDSLLENLQAICPGFCVKIQPELDLIIQSALWFGSIGKKRSSFGQQYLLLSYDRKQLSSIRLYLHFAFTVLSNYVKNLSEYRTVFRTGRIQDAIEWVEKFFVLLSVLNFFRFLKSGRQPTIVDYLLNLDYVSMKSSYSREIGYDYLTRELLWGGFMELIGILIPIINLRKLQQLINFKKSPETHASSKSRKFVCSYCDERPTIPHHIGCEHLFCYYCIAANVQTDRNFSCPICGQKPKFIKLFEIKS